LTLRSRLEGGDDDAGTSGDPREAPQDVLGSPTDLRRAAPRAGISRMMRGAAMKAVQELLGHATMEMTNRYSHLSPEVPRHAVKLLDGLDRVTNPSGTCQGFTNR
jgi:integrase